MNFEQVAVLDHLHFSALKGRQAVRNGKAKAVPFGAAGAVAARKALGELRGADVQLLAGNVPECYDSAFLFFCKVKIYPGSRLSVLADFTGSKQKTSSTGAEAMC